MLDGEAQVLRSDRVDLGVAQLRQTVDKEREVSRIRMLDAKVVDNEAECCVSGGVAEEAGGLCFKKIGGVNVLDKAVFRHPTRVF